MTHIQAIILGIVEGVTEFLPVSSTGHLEIAGLILGTSKTDFTKSFEIIIQLGAILAVAVLYTKRLFQNINVILKVLAAFLPTAIIGLIFYKIIKTYLLGNIWVVLGSLFIGGILILFFEKHYSSDERGIGADSNVNRQTTLSISEISYKQAFLVGIFQSLAMIPGVSRSAATIIGGRLLGLPKVGIVEFSFILAIPTMLAASGLDLLKNYQSFSNSDFSVLILGFVVSFLVALFAIKFFIKYIQKNSFTVFGWYRIVISVLFAIVFFNL